MQDGATARIRVGGGWLIAPQAPSLQVLGLTCTSLQLHQGARFGGARAERGAVQPKAAAEVCVLGLSQAEAIQALAAANAAGAMTKVQHLFPVDTCMQRSHLTCCGRGIKI